MPDPPDNLRIEQGAQPIITDAHLKKHAQELGLIGFIFGSKEHAPLNIAGLVLFLCILAMLASPFMPKGQGVEPGDLLRLFGSLALASLTFLGGYLGGRANH